jgi:hypothetical protein
VEKQKNRYLQQSVENTQPLLQEQQLLPPENPFPKKRIHVTVKPPLISR